MGLSVSGISPISGGVSAISYVAPRVQTNAISNESVISDAYKDSLKSITSPEGIAGPAPVQYADSNIRVGAADRIAENQRANKAYNDVVSSFGANAVTYGRDAMPQGYETFGAHLDAFV